MLFLNPVHIGSTVVKNRIALAPMDTEMSGFNGEVTAEMIEYYEARARGGVGLIFTEFTAVNSQYRLTSPGIYSDKLISGWERLVDRVHSYDTKIILQLALHGGRAPKKVTGVTPIAPSALKSPLFADVPRELTKEEIHFLVDEFIDAAVRASKAGFDGVEIHGGHGYLIGQFLSPHTNRRSDEYGGSFENRLRFAKEILEGIRRNLGNDFVVGFKFSAYEKLENGIDLSVAKRIALSMEKAGVDYLHVSVLTFPLGETKFPSVPPIYTESPPLVDIAGEIKRTVNIPVVAVGGFGSVQEVEEALRKNKADIIAVGRSLIADPDMVHKFSSKTPVRPCIRCNTCHTRIMEQKTLRCAVNQDVGHRSCFPQQVSRSSNRKKIVVVGAGPAGIIFSVTAGKLGHEVTLLEARDRIGGKIVYGSIPAFKRPLRSLLSYYEYLLESSSVDLRLNHKASISELSELSPDVVVVATGGKVRPLSICGSAVDPLVALENPLLVGDSVLIVGAGMVGCELAWYLSDIGRKVHLTDILSEEELMQKEHYFNRLILLEKVKERVEGIYLKRKISVKENAGGYFVNAGETSFEVQTVVNATGFEPENDFVSSLKETFSNVMIVGDAKKVGTIYDAVQDAYMKAMTLRG